MGLIKNSGGPQKDMSRPLSGSKRQSFLDFLTEHDMQLIPGEALVEHGRGRTVSAYNGHQPKNKGWYLLYLHQEHPVGFVFDWREGERYLARWQPEGVETLTDEQKRVEREIIRKHQAELAAERAEKHAREAEVVRAIWSQAAPIDTHPYLEAKQVRSHGLRLSPGPDFEGYLLIPYRDETKQIVTLSYVNQTEDGSKKFWHKGAKRTGTYSLIGPEKLRDSPARINYVEGYASGASWYEHICEEEPIVVCGDANGMKQVPKTFYEWYPDSVHVFIADNDESGTGQAAALVGANEVKRLGGEAETIVPGDVGEDANDAFNAGKLVDRDHREDAVSVDYIRSATQRVMPIAENYLTLVKKNSIDLAYNVIKKEMTINVPDQEFIHDLEEDAILAYLENQCILDSLPHDRLRVNIPLLAREYNPVKEWIEEFVWDGKTRIPELLATVESEDESLKEILMRKWLAGCAAAACLPDGANTEGVLIFVGKQALGKTQWLKKLVPDRSWVLEGATLNPSDKDSVKHAVSHWLVELGEMGSTFKKDLNQLKAFLTKDKDELRLPYGRSFSSYQRRTSFYGSVNEREFLVDPTGNRRFWVVRCNHINWRHSIDIQQLWAEVIYEVRQGKQTWRLTEQEIERLQASNEISRTQSAVEDLLLQQIDFEGVNTKPVQMAKLLGDVGLKAPRMADYKEAARVLHDHGIRPRKSHGKKIYDVDYTPLDTPTVPHYTPDF